MCVVCVCGVCVCGGSICVILWGDMQYLIILYDYAGNIHATASTASFPAPKISNPGGSLSQIHSTCLTQ